MRRLGPSPGEFAQQLSRRGSRPPRGRRGLYRRAALATILLGGALGVSAAVLLRGQHPGWLSPGQPRLLVTALGSALVFGGAAAYYFRSRQAMSETASQLCEEALERATGEQRLAEANLKLLQAQMEPHFLFNTLANILGLIDERPAEASRLLTNLTAYLRGSLRRAPSGATTLGDEIELVRAYLEIQAARMGKRLRYALDVPAELHDLPLPPLLLQPLVENPVRHALERRPEGGQIAVRAAREGDALVLEVRDSGSGLTGDPALGLGLSNVRSRLRALYGEGFGMLVRPNEPQGLCVRLTIPLARHGPPLKEPISKDPREET